ncbi:MAG TPA: pyridoxal 5'-phosphate synthase glutaminase subunit PdxT [Desulfobacteria bacterium]|nr:pyridoxal 5'-phosphate synthase glutaminase subunit PdxT [Desulfobacteria bacterium]
MRIGVLALQGAFIEHEKVLQELGCETVQVRKKEQLEEIDGLIIPGGESTTIGKLMEEFDLAEGIKKKANEGMPVFGTCAGLIVLATDIFESAQPRLGLMNIVAHRNAFGRQVDSFETDLDVKGLEGEPFKAVFIRAPYIKEAGKEVDVLASHNDKIVLARQGNIMAAAFHPELTDDNRIHRIFIDLIKAS